LCSLKQELDALWIHSLKLELTGEFLDRLLVPRLDQGSEIEVGDGGITWSIGGDTLEASIGVGEPHGRGQGPRLPDELLVELASSSLLPGLAGAALVLEPMLLSKKNA
jgi:hypothetical protein